MKIPFIAKPSYYTSSGHVYDLSEKITKAFTRKSKFGDTVELYKQLPEHRVMVPRQCGEIVNDRRVKGWSIDTNSYFKPRSEEQSRIADTCSNLLLKNQSHIMEASTGFGKTIVGTEIAHRVGKKFMVVVPKADVVSQWMKAFEIVLGFTKDDVGLVQGDVCNVAGKKAVIAMVHSICKDYRYPSWIYKEFGLTIIDECHVISAETFSNAMWVLPAKLRLGLSATPYRMDGKDFVFYSHIGPVKAKSSQLLLTPKVIAKKCKYVIPSKKVYVEVNGKTIVAEAKDYTKPGRTNNLNSLLADSIQRNRMIAEFVVQAYRKGRRTIIFAEMLKHLDNLELELRAAGVKSRDIGYYVGGLTADQREAVKLKPVIQATYKMTSMATDIPWLDTCVLATPRTDVVQIVGRILREYDDKQEPVVFDVIDTDCKLFVTYYKKRKKWYTKIGSKIVNM